MNRRQTGAYGERQAEKFLRKKGMKLIERNFSCFVGEIDLIMRDRDTVVFVEVKLRGEGAWASPADYVNLRKQRNVAAAASLWLQSRPEEEPYRFDVVEVFSETGEVRHMESAF